ncbi:MAG: protein-tyrosine kinase [Massilibacteroides sp.]|nr:protein-tyrosine kinase [Massilibacteroides sp.]
METGIIKIDIAGVQITPVDGKVWMTQHQIANLFECFVSKVNSNIRSILKSGVLWESDVCRVYHYKSGNFVEQYNMEMIIALSFQIKSRNTEVFRKYIIEKSVRTEKKARLILPLHIMDINNLN